MIVCIRDPLKLKAYAIFKGTVREVTRGKLMNDSETLLPCPFCGNSNVHSHRPQAALGAWVSCHSCGLETPTETGVTQEQAIAYWNTRAPQPTRDAAEGTGPVDCAEQMLLQARKAGSASWTNIYAAQLQMFACAGHEVRAIPFAPPQPAPDAMREALKDALGEIVLVIAFLERDGGTDRLPATIKSLVARLVKADRAIRDTLSAPVPPADGANETLGDYKRHWLSFLNGWFRNMAEAQRAIEVAEQAKLFDPSQHGALSPSGTGVAEPGERELVDAEIARAHEQDAAISASEVEFMDKLRATLPVRGDRKTLLWASGVAAKGAKQCSDGDSDWHKGFRYAAQNTALGIAADLERAALSLPVQPADESKVYAVLKKYLPLDATLDSIWQDIKEAGIFSGGVHLGAGEREAVIEESAKLCDAIEISAEIRANGLPSQSPGQNAAYEKAASANTCARAIRALSRQASHSSSEGGR